MRHQNRRTSLFPSLSLPKIQRLESSSAQNPGTPNSRWLILILFLLEQIQFGKKTSLLSLSLSSHLLKFYHHHHHHHQPRNIVFFGLSIIKKIKTEEGSCSFANSIPLNRKELGFFLFLNHLTGSWKFLVDCFAFVLTEDWQE